MMRNDRLPCIRECGVDNIDAYPIVINNLLIGEMLTGYNAINIIGLARAAGAARTVYSPDNPSRLIDADVDGLAIDHGRAGGCSCFGSLKW